MYQKRLYLSAEVGLSEFLSEDLAWKPSRSDKLQYREIPRINIEKVLRGKYVPFTNPAYSLNLVRSSFEYQKGQKLGMVVNFTSK